jgi:Fe-S cluster biogenesis protein NfuA
MARLDPNLFRRRVELALDRLRPALLQDGGNLELIDVSEDGTVRIELQGACVQCPAQAATLRYALEPALRRAVPEVIAIVPPGAAPRGPRGDRDRAAAGRSGASAGPEPGPHVA